MIINNNISELHFLLLLHLPWRMSNMRSGMPLLEITNGVRRRAASKHHDNIIWWSSIRLSYRISAAFPRWLAAYENVRIEGLRMQRWDSRMERALKGNTAGYESKIEVMVNDFTSRYGDSKSKNTSQSRKKKIQRVVTVPRRQHRKDWNPVESDKEKVDLKSQIDPWQCRRGWRPGKGNDPFGNFSIFGNGTSEIRMRMNSELTGGEGDGRAAIKWNRVSWEIQKPSFWIMLLHTRKKCENQRPTHPW